MACQGVVLERCHNDFSERSPPSFHSGVAPFACASLQAKAGGGGGIRTHEAFRPAGSQDRSHKPLDHPSRKISVRWKCAIAERLIKLQALWRRFTSAEPELIRRSIDRRYRNHTRPTDMFM